MRTSKRIVLGACFAALWGAPAALADSYWEVEAARANARAGGPVSERDAELLERYGCLSGTRSRFCQQLEGRGKVSYKKKRRKYQ